MGKKKCDYKENFDIFTKCEPFYTGGRIQFTKDGQFILSICDEKLKLFKIEDGKTEDAVESIDDETISTFLLADDDETLITAAKNGIMRQYQRSTKVILKTWKSLHNGPICYMAFDATSTLLATGGSDSTIKVWDIVRKYYTHNLKGGQGVYSKICFHTVGSELHVFGSAADYQIHIWNLNTSECVASLEGHFSTITEILFAKGNIMLSSSRDKVILVWDVNTFKLLKTIPVYEIVEACFLAPKELVLSDVSFSDNDTYFITAGDKGILRVWSTMTAKCVYEQTDSPVILPKDSKFDGSLITQGMYVPALEAISIATFEHNIIVYSLEQFSIKKQFIGYNDEILSVKFMGSEDKQLAVATNSAEIRVYQFPTFTCQLLKGHLDIVMSLDVFHKHEDTLVSGSKDNSVKVWIIDSDSVSVDCVYTGYGHTASVTAVACCKGKSRFFASGSEDTTLKLWDVPEKTPSIAVKLLLVPYCTVKAHDKYINSIDISKNDKLVATGSQDHTAKIWDSSNLTLLATFSGHTKGVWCVNFSPVDLALATSSGDETIRIWSLVDFSCLKVFQGHEASVLQVQFLGRGTQFISSASDGNLKLWDIKNNMCIKTLEGHSVKVWTLTASSSEEFLVSGGADSNIIVWQDTTKIEKEKLIMQTEELIMQDQKLQNLVHEEKWPKALSLAITLGKPYLAYNIIEEILHLTNGETIFEKVFTDMRQDQQEALLKFAVEWITNSKTCYEAVKVINFFFKIYDFQDLLKNQSVSLYVRDFLPYLDRHYKRLNRRCQDMLALDFLCKQFKFIDRLKSGDSYNNVQTEIEKSNTELLPKSSQKRPVISEDVEAKKLRTS